MPGRIRRRLSRFQPSKSKAMVILGFECLPTAYVVWSGIEENAQAELRTCKAIGVAHSAKTLGKDNRFSSKKPRAGKGPARGQGLNLVNAAFRKLIGNEDEHNAKSRNEHGRKRRLDALNKAGGSGKHIRRSCRNSDSFTLGEERKGRNSSNSSYDLFHGATSIFELSVSTTVPRSTA